MTNNLPPVLLKPSFWVWGRGLILTLCWRGMNLPIPVRILMKLIYKKVFYAHKNLNLKEWNNAHIYSMFSSLITASVLIITSLFYIRSNPLSIGIIVLAIALTATLFISLLMSSWLCFLVFLIYIGGILVLFSYFVAITPNIPIPSLIINIILLILLPVITILSKGFPSTLPQSTQPEIYISFLYMGINTPTLALLALTLFITIVIVVKLIFINKGPLRPFIYV